MLTVAPYPVFPGTHGGRVRCWGLAQALVAAGDHVDLLFPWTPGQPLRASMRDGVALHPQRFAWNVVPRLVPDRAVPSVVSQALQPYAIGPRLRLRRFDGHDAVLFELPNYARWMGRAPRGAKVVYSAHNVEYDFWSALLPPTRRRPHLLRAIRAIEARAVAASDMLLVPTAADEQRFGELYGPLPRVKVLNQAATHDLSADERDRLRPAARARLGLLAGERAVLFVGGPSPHNEEAARFLEHEVLPELGPEYRLVLAGECVTPANGEGGRALRLGYVDDLRPLLAAADVAANPVPWAAGMSLKVAEYRAAGLPVVATPAGVRGVRETNGDVHVAERTRFVQVLREVLVRPGSHAHGRAAWPDRGPELHDALAALL